MSEEALALTKKYADLGLNVEVQSDPLRLESINLGSILTLEDWYSFLDTDKGCLPSCCGDISYARNIIIDALRSEKEIETVDLYRFCKTVEDHSSHYKLSQTDDGPVAKLHRLWKQIEEDTHLELWSSKKDPDNVIDALNMLGQMCYMLTFNIKLDRDLEGLNFDDECIEKKVDHASEKLWKRKYEILKLSQPLKTAYHKLRELVPDVTEQCWAIIDHKGNVASNYSGYAFYRREEVAKDVLKISNKGKKTDKFTLRRIRLTFDNGVEFLD